MQVETHYIADALRGKGYRNIESVYTLRPGATVRISTHDKPPSNSAVKVHMFADGQGAYFQDYVTGDCGPIWPDNPRRLSKAETAILSEQAKKRKLQAELQRQTKHARTDRIARDTWKAGITAGSHPYVDRKGLSGLHNARIDTESGALLIPMWVPDAGLMNLQRIYPDGAKRFIRDGKVKGAYSVIGSLNDADCVLICEGWSTGCTLRELHDVAIVVAFNAGNLLPVGQAIRSRFPDISIVIAADDDRQNTVNIGREKAMQAAQAIGATLLLPELCKACKCTDHNDVMLCRRRCAHG